MNDIHVLVLPSWYPSRHHHLNGIFVVRQVRYLAQQLQVGVAYAEMRSLRSIFRPGTHSDGGETCVLEDGVPTCRVERWNLPTDTLRSLVSYKGIGHVVTRYVSKYGAPDVLHAHATFWAGSAAWRIARRLEVPWILTEHWSGFRDDELSPWQQRVAARVLPAAQRVIAVGESLAAHLADYRKGDVDVVPNVVETEVFVPPPVRGNRAGFTFVAVASLTEVKRLDLLIRAFAHAFAGHQNTQLIIVGDGPLRQRLRTLAARSGAGEAIEFRGSLSREGVRSALWAADAFVSASRTETFGIALAEAMATGLPVVATRSGGAEEVVGEQGILVPTNDLQELANALVRIRRGNAQLGSPEERRLSIVRRYAPHSVVERLTAIYSQVVKGWR